MLRRDPKERLSAQECLDHGILRLLQSGKIPIAEEHLETVNISSASFSISQVKEEIYQMTTYVDIGSLFPTALGSLIEYTDDLETEYEYESGVEETVAWNSQETDESGTPVPAQKSRPDTPQPIPYGLVLAENNEKGPKIQQGVVRTFRGYLFLFDCKLGSSHLFTHILGLFPLLLIKPWATRQTTQAKACSRSCSCSCSRTCFIYPCLGPCSILKC